MIIFCAPDFSAESGSLGSPAEKAYLVDTYNSEVIYVPPFLTTCTGAKKYQASLENGKVTIENNRSNQIRGVVELALRKQKQVPVIVVCQDARVARRVHQELRHSSQHVQLLLEKTKDGRPMNYSYLVEQATKPVTQNQTEQVLQWRTTVTDVFGGRGQDYRINDDDVDAAGGLLVIAMSIPLSEREFIQWKGRTARGDRRGQYALILNAEDAPLKHNEDKWKQHGDATVRNDGTGNNVESYEGSVYKKAVVGDLLKLSDKDVETKLLKLSDKDVETKLEKMKQKQKTGQRLNALCDQFYQKYGRGGEWPEGAEQIKLRDFLKRREFSLDQVARFAASVDLRR